jgi:hypothetical protein
MYDHEDGFTELKMKKPNGMFTMSHETSTGMKIDLGVTNTTINNAIEAINEFTILILIVLSSMLLVDANLDKK